MYPKNPFSHIDLRVTDLPEALPFYEALLPALGFTHAFHSSDWRVWAADGTLPSAAYFAITEDPNHIPNANLIGLWAESRAQVDAIAALVATHGGTLTDGPRLFPISPTYYSVYFQDPCGNKYEFLHREN